MQVQSGDTVLGIAEKFGLYPETIQWSNPELEANPDLLRIGDELANPAVERRHPHGRAWRHPFLIGSQIQGLR